MIDVLREMQKKKMMLVKASKAENIHKKEYILCIRKEREK